MIKIIKKFKGIKYVSIGAIAILAIFTIIVIKLLLPMHKYKNENKLFNNIYERLELITSREKLKFDNNFVYIGYDKKQLENDYYDIKIKLENTQIDVYINCLEKNYIKEGIIDKEYLSEFCNYINYICFNNLNYDKLFDSIEKQYLKLRQGYEFNNIEVIEYIDTDYIVSIYEDDAKLHLRIRGKTYGKKN